MVNPGQMQDTDGDGEGDDDRPQIGSVGFVIGTRSLCVYTPLGWVDVEVDSSSFSTGSYFENFHYCCRAETLLLSREKLFHATVVTSFP